MKNLYLANSFFMLTLDAANIRELSNNSNFLLLWLEKGDITLLTVIKEEHLEGKRIYMIGPEGILTLSHSKDVLCYCMGFSLDFLQTDAKEYLLDIFNLFFFKMDTPAITLSDADSAVLEKLNSLMLIEFGREDAAPGILQAYLKIILLMLIRKKQISHSLVDINIQRLHDFFLLAHENFPQQKKVFFYAEKLNISAKRLNQILHFYTKRSITQLLQEMLITEAKRQLITGKHTINQISDKLGFTDRAYFSRFFKKMTGTAPSEFRDQL